MSQLKVYTTPGSPPSTAVMALCTILKLPVIEVSLDYLKGEIGSEEHFKRNPQREVPVLEDSGFFLSESVAILQYLSEKYGGVTGETLYPKDPQKRAIVNHRMAFSLSTLYPAASKLTYGAATECEADPKKESGAACEKDTKVLEMTAACAKALKVFETILERQNTKFAAGDSVTVSDLVLLSTISCIGAIDYDLSPYPRISSWSDRVKNELPSEVRSLYQVCQEAIKKFLQS